MSKTKWTPAQKTAIEHRGGSMLVSAAAGSGKTAVLVERVSLLLTDPVSHIDADKLLIVTFTNAAAAELRGRIAKSIESMIRETPCSDGKRLELLRRQKVRLQRASICTMDAFCLSLLQKNFASLDIPPDFATADSAQLARLREEALAQVMEESCHDADFCRFSDLYGRSRDDRKAGDLILKLYDFLRSLPQPWKTLEEFCRAWELGYPMEDTPWSRELAAGALQKANTALTMAAGAKWVAQQSENGQEKYVPTLQGDEMVIGWLKEELEQVNAGQVGTWEKARETLEGWRWEKMGTIRGEKTENEKVAQFMRDSYKKNIIGKMAEEFLICTPEQFEQDCRMAAPLVRALARAVKRFDTVFFEAKKAEKILEFSDFEHLTLQLLQNEDGEPTEAAARLSQDYAAILVDEYQDTNALQDAIYTRLANPQGSNRFLVGDLKQSIYRFRQADPAVFMEKMNCWPVVKPGNDCGEKNVSLELDANFRSAPAVVDAINYFFEQIMSRELGGVDYGPGQALVAGAPNRQYRNRLTGEMTDYSGFCRFVALETEEKYGDAPVIARMISKMVSSRRLVRDGDVLRPCEWGDFCILLRGRKGFSAYAAELEKQGIPVYADVSENLLEAPQVQPLAALLRVLDNPAQDIPLAAAMLSPMFGFTPDDLVALRAETPRGSLYGALAASQNEKMQQFCQRLRMLRRAARAMSCAELLEKILAETGYMAAVGAMPGGSVRQQGLQGFVRWAGQAGQGGLGALIRGMDAAAKSEGIAGTDQGQRQPGCVSIMTVHRSKGLEFPIVFVAQTNHKFNLQDLNEPVLFHRELGIGMNLRVPGGAGMYRTLAGSAIRQRLRAESVSEEMRILYVALTRAKDGLILMVPMKNAAEELQKKAMWCGLPEVRKNMLEGAQNWGEWLTIAAILHPDATLLRIKSGIGLEPAHTSSKLQVEIVQEEEKEEKTLPRQSLPTGQPDETLLRQLQQNFAWQDPRRALRSIPGKVSVTAVVHGKQESQLARPAFLYKEGLTGAERGTATHAFLQSADFALAALDLDAEIRRQTECSLILPEMAEKLDKTALHRFFASPLFARVQAAQSIRREYAFITSLPARFAMQDKTGDYGSAETLVQGVADLILLFADHAEIVDYKTDRSKTPAQLAESYGEQLRLYCYALHGRLPVPITKCTIFSLRLGAEVDIPVPEDPEKIIKNA